MVFLATHGVSPRRSNDRYVCRRLAAKVAIDGPESIRTTGGRGEGEAVSVPAECRPDTILLLVPFRTEGACPFRGHPHSALGSGGREEARCEGGDANRGE